MTTVRSSDDPDCTLRAIRIYTGSIRWGNPEDWPDDGKPIRIEGFMGAGDLDLHFGRVPSQIREQLAARDAFLSAVLQVGFGLGGGMTAEEIIAAHDDERSYKESWYVTFVFDRRATLPERGDSEDADGDRLWWDWVKAEPTFDRFAEEARQIIDTATVHLSSQIGPGCLDRRIDPKDQIVILRKGKKLSTVPKITGSAHPLLTKAVANFPAEAISERFARLDRSVCSAHRWLNRAIQWYALSMLAEDPRREFQTAWLALEIFVNKGASRYRAEVTDALRVGDTDGEAVAGLLSPEDRASLTQRFAIVALKLSPESAADDLAGFKTAKKGRDAVAHGVHDDPDQLPIAETKELCRRYIDLALEDLLA